MREIKQKWFASATPINANYASVDIGEGDNGVVTITADTLGTEENSYSIELVEGVGADIDGTTIYICTEPVDKYSTDGWKTGTLSAV
jgi:hypothetical protein